jgi:four helix bundle protein
MPKPNHRPIVSYRDLDAWQLAMDIVIDVYRLTRALPAEERFGLSAQLRRAAVAIPSNIAEGHSRIGGGEFRRFVSIARGSGAEVETQIAVAVALGLIVGDEITSLSSKLDRLSKMLFSLYRSLQT